MDCQFVVRNEGAKRHADQLMRLITQDAMHGWVDRGKVAVKVKRRNDVVGRVDQQAVALLAVRQRLFGNLSFRDVQHKTKTALGPACTTLAAERHSTLDENPSHGAVRAQDAMLVLKGTGARHIETLVPQELKARTIFGMHALGNLEGHRRICWQAKNGLQLRRPGVLARIEVEAINPELG